MTIPKIVRFGTFTMRDIVANFRHNAHQTNTISNVTISVNDYLYFSSFRCCVTAFGKGNLKQSINQSL